MSKSGRRPGWSRRAASACLAILLAVLAPIAAADSLTPMQRTALPPIADADAQQLSLAIVDGRLLAIDATRAWRLDAAGTSWRPLRVDATPSSRDSRRVVFGDGSNAFALQGVDAAPDGVSTKGVVRLTVVEGTLRSVALAPLPQSLSRAQAAASGGVVSVAGLDAAGRPQLLRLDTARADARWTPLAAWPGGAPDTLVAQGALLLLTTGGSADAAGRLHGWAADGGWSDLGPMPGPVLPGAARALGQSNALYLVGAVGDTAGARVMTYQTITRAWAVLPGVTVADAVAVAPWRDGIAWATRGAGGGVEVASAQVTSGTLLLKWLDWLVIVVYLAAMIGIGLYFYVGEKRTSTASFFVGGRSIPFWAAGVSLYATNVSSISFIAIPAKAFETNWQYLTNNLIAVLGLVFVAIWVVPLLRRLDLMSVFSYLETRFHPAIRMLASGLCILTQIGSRMSVILFLPSLAIATITGIDVTWSILLMGGFTILYTTLGGMKAVVWTDFAQVFVMFGGALFAIGYILLNLDGGVPEFLATAAASDKTKLFDFSFDLTKATVWGFIFLVLFDVVLTFPKDQVLMQRVLSTRSDREAGRSVWTFAAIMIPGGFLFYLIGTALFVFYKSHPERMNPLLPLDATFPLFIAAELPMGITGLIIAGIFAAAMSTLSSIINSVSTLASVDFYEKIARNPTPRRSVLFAEVTGVLVGLAGIGLALLLSRLDIHSLFDVSIELAGLLGGGFAGAYTLGMFTRRANAPGVAIGIGSSIALTTVAWSFQLVHPYFYLAISILLCIVIGYVASLCFPAPTRSLDGLTVYRDLPKAIA